MNLEPKLSTRCQTVWGTRGNGGRRGGMDITRTRERERWGGSMSVMLVRTIACGTKGTV